MSKASAIFDELTSSETRARCPRVEPTVCQGRKKEYHIQIEPDHAFCHRCQYTWHFEDKKMDKLTEIAPPKIREPLYIKSNEEYVITYNVDQGNLNEIPPNTILVHRKKDTNTLYTINALNELIKSLNGGVVDTQFPIDWQHYRNCILLTQHNEIKQLNTKIFKIIEL